jgi:hypothetical protein
MNTIINNRTSKKNRGRIAALTLAALLLCFPGLSFARSVTSSTNAAGQVCSIVTLGSDNMTQTAGYTQTNPIVAPLNPALYAHPFSAATRTQAVILPWIDPSININFNTSSSTWISTHSTWPGGVGNTEGTSTSDQWRLFHDQFTIPAGATFTAADIWYTADNAVALYQNGIFLDRTGGTASDDVFGAIPAAMPQVFANIFHNTLTPSAGMNTIDFVTRNWAVSSTTSATNPTGLLYKAVIRYCMPPPAVAPTTGDLVVVNTVSGGTATSADFQIHVMKDGVDITGSPRPGSSTGTTYSTIATGTYAVSRTAGLPANYSTALSGDCNTLGNVTVLASTTKTCTITNTFTGTTTPPTTATSTIGTGNLRIMTVINGGTATASALQVHIKKAGIELSGSPFAAVASGFTLSGLATGAYVVSQTGTPAGYSVLINDDCDASGNVTIASSTTKICTFTNTFTGSTSTGTTTPPSATPQARKQGVLDELIAIKNDTTNSAWSWRFPHRKDDTRDDHRGEKRLLDDAVLQLRLSLHATLWKDASHISDTRGDMVFDREQNAIDDLIHVIKSSEDSVLNAKLQGFIDRLLDADRMIATTAIADAISAGGKAQTIVKANSALARGDIARANDKTLRAMWRYQRAWGFATTSH